LERGCFDFSPIKGKRKKKREMNDKGMDRRKNRKEVK
jgi:hypothetical protein